MWRATDGGAGAALGGGAAPPGGGPPGGADGALAAAVAAGEASGAASGRRPAADRGAHALVPGEVERAVRTDCTARTRPRRSTPPPSRPASPSAAVRAGGCVGSRFSGDGSSSCRHAAPPTTATTCMAASPSAPGTGGGSSACAATSCATPSPSGGAVLRCPRRPLRVALPRRVPPEPPEEPGSALGSSAASTRRLLLDGLARSARAPPALLGRTA